MVDFQNETNLAPIALFVYNRPKHTSRTLKALSKNSLIGSSEIFVFADGPKPDASRDELRNIESVRELIRRINWCKKVTVIERPENWGLAKSIIDGVTTLVSKQGKVIVLEDDIVTSTGFLSFMNGALEKYKDNHKIWHVSGYWYPVKGGSELPDTFFLHTATCWGWGTWQRAWKNFCQDSLELLKAIGYECSAIEAFNLNSAYPFFEHLKAQSVGQLNSWAIRWYASIFINRALSLHPKKSFTNNIGFDGSGTHSFATRHYEWSRLAKKPRLPDIPLMESELAVHLLKPYFQSEHENSTHIILESKKFKSLVKRFAKHALSSMGLKIEREYQDPFAYLKTLPRYVPTQVEIFGRNFEIPDSLSFYYSYQEIFLEKCYDFPSSNPSPLIIDCGCNCGLSILFFKTKFPAARILGFEADPKIFRIAANNIANFKLSGVTLLNKAIWKSHGLLKFHPDGADGGQLHLSEGDSINNSIEVESEVLSKFLENKKIDLLKIDIEGAEMAVLEECRGYLSNVSFLFVEYHYAGDENQDLGKMLNLLSDVGFKFYLKEVVRISSPFQNLGANSFAFQTNIFCFRPSSE